MTATIHHCEIFAWQKRQLAGEIYITGMAASTKGYVLTYMETKGMPPLNTLSALVAIPKPAPTPPVADLAPAAVRMVVCPNCSAEYPEGETCGICSRFGQIAEKARVKRRAWHLFKCGKGPRP